jgi:hypothetical protein
LHVEEIMTVGTGFGVALENFFCSLYVVDIRANGTTLEVMSRRHVVLRRSNALWRLNWTHGQPTEGVFVFLG